MGWVDNYLLSKFSKDMTFGAHMYVITRKRRTNILAMIGKENLSILDLNSTPWVLLWLAYNVSNSTMVLAVPDPNTTYLMIGLRIQ